MFRRFLCTERGADKAREPFESLVGRTSERPHASPIAADQGLPWRRAIAQLGYGVVEQFDVHRAAIFLEESVAANDKLPNGVIPVLAIAPHLDCRLAKI